MKTAITLGCLLAVLTACSPATPTVMPTHSSTLAQRPTIAPTRTPPESDSRQTHPTLTVASASTPMPTTTLKPPTPTMAPTLTTDQEQALIVGLLQNNGGCKLPCWWGFTPGQTTWQTARTFFVSLGKIPAEYHDPNMLNYSVTFRIPKHSSQSDQVYIIGDGLINAIWVEARTMRNQETVYGDNQFVEDWQRYFLPQLLTTYGQPAQVLLKPFAQRLKHSYLSICCSSIHSGEF
jgi:hypothetical protein